MPVWGAALILVVFAAIAARLPSKGTLRAARILLFVLCAMLLLYIVSAVILVGGIE